MRTFFILVSTVDYFILLGDTIDLRLGQIEDALSGETSPLIVFACCCCGCRILDTVISISVHRTVLIFFRIEEDATY